MLSKSLPTTSAHDFCGDAKTSLNNLTMKDQRITRYIVNFNKLAVRTEWNEPALQDCFYRGLPARIRTELLRGGKPTTLIRMCLKAQQVDQAYWMTKDELSKETKAHPSNSKKDDAKSAPSKKPYCYDQRPHWTICSRILPMYAIPLLYFYLSSIFYFIFYASTIISRVLFYLRRVLYTCLHP